MTLTDNNPKTQGMTQALMATKWRAVYSDGDYIEQESGKNQYDMIDRSRLVALVIIKPDGTEALKVDIPKHMIGVYRQRTIANHNGVQVIRILGLIDRNNHDSQILYFLFRAFHVEIVDDPDEFEKYGKIRSLRASEV